MQPSPECKSGEPTFAKACRWWPDLPYSWTPIGWKDHLFRYNILWNGTILAQPFLNRRSEQWDGQGIQLTPTPSRGIRGHGETRQIVTDDAKVLHGWESGAAPVLWSEWPHEGVLLRQSVFAHVPGAQAVETGIEPLFAWVRLTVHDACPTLPLEAETGFLIRLNAPHFCTVMDLGHHYFDVAQSAYPRVLAAEAETYSPTDGWRLLEEDGAVRLGIAPGQSCTVTFTPVEDGGRDAWLSVKMPNVVGTHVDLLVPMVPTAREDFDRELALGYDGARAEANHFWSTIPPTAAKIETPEAFINDTITHSLKFAEVIAEKNPADGHYSFLSGSYTYADLWSTPFAMNAIMLLDTLGYHEVVARHLEIFRAEQGTVVPPGKAFVLHPGYLSSPKTLTSIDWLSDHGAILYVVAEHALLTGDRQFITGWQDAILRACEFIRDARALTNHDGVKGVLPPAAATDCMTEIQAVWSSGWNYKGLMAAVKLLRQIGHPRAEEFAGEADEYRTAFQQAFRAKAAEMPTWTDADGAVHPFTPTAFSGDQPWERRHAFYLDAGPMFPVFAGLFPADDPLMQASIRWFREGPQTRFYRRFSNCWQTPCLDHEISSCEPCYSWNLFHSHQLGDRAHFLEGLYSLFAGALSRQTYISCETRGGITGNLFATPLAIYLARLAMIDDQLAENELHLLRLMPLAWLQSGQATTFDQIPTEYGPVSLRTRLDGEVLDVEMHAAFRVTPRVWLHIPPLPGLREVRVNGKSMPAVRPMEVQLPS